MRELVNDLEVRFLANREPNLHFALLTDLPDSVSKPRENDSHPLVELAVRLIDDLNEKYDSQNGRSLLSLSASPSHLQHAPGRMDGLGTKARQTAGPEQAAGRRIRCLSHQGRGLEGLRKCAISSRWIPTRSFLVATAAQLVGAIAHPLNQAVIDPKRRIVTDGYGILQPRIGVAVRSAARSRLAAIYSGQSGFDIYTRAISDAYQDLFGEGIFTGKGIYEVATLHAVLDRRFPRNALLSHDLIEGAYARAGLATDIELVDDYPSHYSAYIRRKHRWVRGDWQIVQWMFSRVPDESGRWATNPISEISRWKIFDNLRRSLVEPFSCSVCRRMARVAGRPTLLDNCCPVPAFLSRHRVQFAFGLGRAIRRRHKGQSQGSFPASARRTGVTAPPGLSAASKPCSLSMPSSARSSGGSSPGERLLEWETAAQS